MTRTEVAIVKGKQPFKMIEKVLHLVEAKDIINSEDCVLIKPNYVVSRHPSSGLTTDSRVIESLIQFVKNIGVKDVIVGEGGAGDTEGAFDVVSISKVASRKKARLVNLNKDERVNMKIPDSIALREVGVARTVLESTCIINVPTLKVHHMALVTLSMKNLMGFILPKSIMHTQINEKIVDLASLFKDKVKINIIDGLIGAEIDETTGTPIKMQTIIAGRDMVAVDTIGTLIMGINPRNVEYLNLAEDKGLGVSKLNKIKILGDRIEDVKKKFKLPPTFT
jgi:uncharacterized protein (DUF362 family)